MLSPVQTWLLEGGVCSHRPLPAQVPEAVAPCQASSVTSVASRVLPGVPAILLSVNVWTCVLLEHGFSGRAGPLNSRSSFS